MNLPFKHLDFKATGLVDFPLSAASQNCDASQNSNIDGVNVFHLDSCGVHDSDKNKTCSQDLSLWKLIELLSENLFVDASKLALTMSHVVVSDAEPKNNADAKIWIQPSIETIHFKLYGQWRNILYRHPKELITWNVKDSSQGLPIGSKPLTRAEADEIGVFTNDKYETNWIYITYEKKL